MEVAENRLSPSSLIPATSLAAAVVFFAASARSISEALRLPANPSSDFAAFWRAGGWVRNHASQSLYPLSSFGTSSRVDRTTDTYLGFVNPPHTAPPFALLADLPLGRAFAVFTALNIVMLIAILIVLGLTLHAHGWNALSVATALLVTAGSAPSAAVLVNGTLSLISVTGLLLLLRSPPSTKAPASGANWLPALGLTLLSIKPQYAILPAVLLLSQRRYAILAKAAALISALIGGSLAATGIKPWVEYLPFLTRYAATGDLWQVSKIEEWLPKQMPNLRGLGFRILGLNHTAAINRFSTAALIVAIGFVWWIGRQRNRNTNLIWALTIALALFTSQHSNVCDGVILIVILVAVVRANDIRFTPARILTAFALLQLSYTFGNPANVTPLLPWSAIGTGLFAVVLAVHCNTSRLLGRFSSN